MDNLISRQAAIDALDQQIRQCDKALADFGISMKDEYAVRVERASLVAFKEQLECLPPAQPEQKHGHWIDKTDPEWDGEWGDWKCSCCGVVLSSMAINLNGTYLYCPKCGADMRGGEDE